MPDVALCVTHGGHGTITEALRCGVPMVCLPNPLSDQAYLASRVSALGAALSVDQQASPDEIRAAVEHVLSKPGYREAAARLKAKIGEGGAGRAADLLETLIPVTVGAEHMRS